MANTSMPAESGSHAKKLDTPSSPNNGGPLIGRRHFVLASAGLLLGCSGKNDAPAPVTETKEQIVERLRKRQKDLQEKANRIAEYRENVRKSLGTPDEEQATHELSNLLASIRSWNEDFAGKEDWQIKMPK